jgi:hypothetical protein
MIADEARMASASKNKTPVGVSAKSQCGNPHRKPNFHSVETPTTVHSVETPTTSILSGKAGERSAPIRSAEASEPAKPKQIAKKKPTDLTLAEINAAWRGSANGSGLKRS